MYRNLNTQTLGITGSQSEIIELALSFGFRGMDLDLTDFMDSVKGHGVEHARRLIDSANIRLGSFPLSIDLERSDEDFEKDLTKLAAHASMAAEAGCTRATLTIAPASDVRPYHENFEHHRKRLAAIAERLEPHGVRLGLGFLAPAELREGKAFEFIHDFEALVVLLNTVGAANVGVVLDLWQVHAGGTSLDAVRTKLKPEQIVTVQLADGPADVPSSEWKMTSRLVPVEPLVVPLAEGLTMLSELEYDGPVSLSPHRDELKGNSRDVNVKLLGKRFEELFTLAGISPKGRVPATAER